MFQRFNEAVESLIGSSNSESNARIAKRCGIQSNRRCHAEGGRDAGQWSQHTGRAGDERIIVAKGPVHSEAANLGSLCFNHLHLQQHLLHAAHFHLVEYGRVKLLGNLNQFGNVRGFGDPSPQHNTVTHGDRLHCRLGKEPVDVRLKMPYIATDKNFNGEKFVVLVGHDESRHAG